MSNFISWKANWNRAFTIGTVAAYLVFAALVYFAYGITALLALPLAVSATIDYLATDKGTRRWKIVNGVSTLVATACLAIMFFFVLEPLWARLFFCGAAGIGAVCSVVVIVNSRDDVEGTRWP